MSLVIFVYLRVGATNLVVKLKTGGAIQKFLQSKLHMAIFNKHKMTSLRYSFIEIEAVECAGKAMKKICCSSSFWKE